MRRRLGLAAFLALAGGAVQALGIQTSSLSSDLDRIFDEAPFTRALVGARVESLSGGRVLYERNAGRLVMPASNLKIATLAVAADRLGWDYRFETRLDAVGTIRAGVLNGDLVVTGTGDPTIGSGDARHAPLFLEWADALRDAGITRIDGRIVGDDNGFDDEMLGAGWAWDYLAAGYAAPVSALSYNENVAVVHITPGASAGSPATVTLTPPGHRLELTNQVATSASGSATEIELLRLPGSARLLARGGIAAGTPPAVRTAALDNPTQSFVEAFRLALASRGIGLADGAYDIDDLPSPVSTGTRLPITRRESAPLSSLIAYSMKESQNFYAEMIFKALGRNGGQPGTAEGARTVMRETLASWGVPSDSIVVYDGSGLSRYNYATAESITRILVHVWQDERLRGPFVAALPVGGYDGTLGGRMKNAALDRRVQAKTGTISNVRALSGYLEGAAGEKIAFAIIANNYTAPVAQVDAAVERALERLLQSTNLN